MNYYIQLRGVSLWWIKKFTLTFFTNRYIIIVEKQSSAAFLRLCFVFLQKEFAVRQEVIILAEATAIRTPVSNAVEINELLRRYGVKFGIYKNGVFKEQLFPFDPIPRVITSEDFKSIEKVLIQRVDAPNKFLFDIYR